MSQTDANSAIGGMTETEEKILDAAIRTFLRYGARKASMNDIALAAGVSRQTLYDAFGGRDGLIRASIRIVTDRNLAKVRARLEGVADLDAQLEIYFQETIVPSFEMLQTAGDVEDLISGHNEAGKDEIAQSHTRHEALVSGLLAPHQGEAAATRQAHFIVTVAMGFKYGAKSRNDLEELLQTLKQNTLCQLTEGSLTVEKDVTGMLRR